ncbi:MAG: hypothetical protein OSJ73_22630 [Lachnospiraceae bacterium]|nr:hypothetical protein [Lachnospiraceae bacterium]
MKKKLVLMEAAIDGKKHKMQTNKFMHDNLHVLLVCKVCGILFN